MAASMKARRDAEDRERLARSRNNVPRQPSNDEPLVNAFAARHGDYHPGTVVDLSGDLGGRRMSMVKVMLNRGGTAVERWIHNDRAGLFGEGEQRAIRY